MNARSDVSGSDANKAAHTVLRFAISETATTTSAVTAILMMYGHIATADAKSQDSGNS